MLKVVEPVLKMKLNLFLLGLAAADNKATVQRVGSDIAIADAEYTPKVTCDVTNNEFRVEVPAWRRKLSIFCRTSKEFIFIGSQGCSNI